MATALSPPLENNEKGSDVKAGTHVKKQLLLWDTFLEWRIRLQKSLVACNALPQSSVWTAVSQSGNRDFDSTQSHALHQLSRLSDALISLNDVLNQSSIGNESEVDEDDDEIASDTLSENGEAAGDDAESDGNDDDDDDENDEMDEQTDRKSVKRKVSDGDSLSFDKIKKIRDEIIDEWYNKTRFSTSSTKKGLESFEQPPTIQIKQIMSDESRLLRRTQLRRSHHPIIGTVESNEKMGKEKEYNPEIFDDDDFYHQLLRELIDNKTGDSGDSASVTRKWLQIQKLRSSMKKKVDTRASKGRKLRYETHKELLNFMAPNRSFNLTDEAKDELFSSLFQ